jgi:Alw26I/Eco31I/Esp3I family type II restriction endonuclease
MESNKNEFVSSDTTQIVYSNKTIPELKKICKEHKITGVSGKNKQQLIEMIQQKDMVEASTRRENYEKTIKEHPNYTFIPEELKRSWVSVSKKNANPRTACWENKRNELIDSREIPEESTFVNVARHIHPTKKHVCKMCNQEQSIYYEYPTSNTWKWLNKQFRVEKSSENEYLTIFELYAKIEHPTKDETFKKNFDGIDIKDLERICKNDQYIGIKLSPGVMGNPPDRLDGFHCYNSICGCRKYHDKGRSDENMKTYTRDRRAYEMYSDGNCLLANSLMGELNLINSQCFGCGKNAQMTADHIGPISLGFIHDPANFQACCALCNSTKNNRLTQEDVDKIKLFEKEGKSMLSWWAKGAWEKTKDTDEKSIKLSLDQNAKNFLDVIEWLKGNKEDILKAFITQSYMNHGNSYKIGGITISSNGEIVFEHNEVVSEKKTKDKQYNRTVQILLEVSKKTNRRVKTTLSETQINQLSDITADNFKSKICIVLEGK